MLENDTSQATALDFEIPSFFKTYSLNSYGGLKIAVYKSKAMEAYFYTPLILVDWNDFENSLIALEEDKNKIQEISIVIQHSDNRIESEIISSIIAADGVKKNADISLNLLPFKFYKIFAKIGDKKIWLNEDDISNLSPEDNFTTQLTLMHERAYMVRGTRDELKYFFNNRKANLIWANLYSDGSPYSTTTVSAIATFFNNSKNIKKIVGDEDLIKTNKVTSSTSGGGFGLSLGPISLGGGSSDSTVSNDQKTKRYLNRTYVSQVISENKSEINLTIDGDTSKYVDLIKQFVDKLFENKQKVEANIKIENDSTLKLTTDQINYVTLPPEQSEMILKAKPVIDKSDENKESFTYGGIKGEKETKNNFKTQDDIEWQKKGADIIPVKVDLYLFSETQLKDEFSSLAILVNREAKKNTITPFLYPAVWLAKNQNYINSNVTDKDNPIGSILAFAGAKEDKPNGWEVCDGGIVKITDYPELFKIIGFKWGKGIDDTEFKIPNLQGQFLRGVDYSKNVDPDVDKRANFLNEIGEVGSYQGYDVQSHNHGYDRPDQSDGPSGSGATNPVRKSFSLQTTADKGGKETRPINAYVNFIIRVN